MSIFMDALEVVSLPPGLSVNDLPVTPGGAGLTDATSNSGVCALQIAATANSKPIFEVTTRRSTARHAKGYRGRYQLCQLFVPKGDNRVDA